MLFCIIVHLNMEEWITMLSKMRKSGNHNSGNSTPRLEKPMYYFVSAKEEKRIENIRAAFRPEAKPKVTLPKFSWDKTDDK